MSHHYGEYWSNWSELDREKPQPEEPVLIDEIKTFLLTLHDSDKAAELIERIENESKENKKPLKDF